MIKTVKKLLSLSPALLGSVRQWHWVSSAIFMAGLLLFAFTGITLNHSDWFDDGHAETTHYAELPANLLMQLRDVQDREEEQLPATVVEWLKTRFPENLYKAEPEWNDDQLVLERSRPGIDALLSIDLDTGQTQLDIIDHGWIALFNDLHKSRHTSLAWVLFTDVFALACIVFGMTGFILLYRQTASRPMTWPLLGLGLVIPLLIILSIH